MPDKDLLLQIAIIRFLTQCEYKGWGLAPLTYVYNCNSPIEEHISVDEFERILNNGDITLKNFLPVFHAVMGAGELVSR